MKNYGVFAVRSGAGLLNEQMVPFSSVPFSLICVFSLLCSTRDHDEMRDIAHLSVQWCLPSRILHSARKGNCLQRRRALGGVFLAPDCWIFEIYRNPKYPSNFVAYPNPVSYSIRVSYARCLQHTIGLSWSIVPIYSVKLPYPHSPRHSRIRIRTGPTRSSVPSDNYDPYPWYRTFPCDRHRRRRRTDPLKWSLNFDL